MGSESQDRKEYAFRCEDNGQIVWVDFATMMTQRNGFLALPDGTEARRCVSLEQHAPLPRSGSPNSIEPPAVSDNLGFPEQCLADRRKQLQQLGCKGIEFNRDPQCPEFIQVHGSSRSALEAYAKKRSLVNRTGSLGGGVRLSQDEMDRAAALVTRVHGV